MCDSTTSELPLTDKNASECSCCGTDAGNAAAEPAEGISLKVQGMTCGHCVSSVTEELEEVDGVGNVSVNLEPKGVSTVTVEASSDVDMSRLQAAVTEAGYEVVAPSL